MVDVEMKLQKLVEKFAYHSAEQSDAMFRADTKAGNRHARQVNSTFAKLCAHGNAGRDALMVLFSHPREDVRGTAAAFLLRHRTKEAQEVLRELASGGGINAFLASESLKRWDEGVWALDPG